MPMPNRQIVNGEPYRYAYQGQEKDPETGKEAFQLRLWDGRIGRWLTTDPKGEFSSPYLGMGNNPIRKIDPDGGSTEEPPTWEGNEGDYYHDPNDNTHYGYLDGAWVETAPEVNLTNIQNITPDFRIASPVNQQNWFMNLLDDRTVSRGNLTFNVNDDGFATGLSPQSGMGLFDFVGNPSKGVYSVAKYGAKSKGLINHHNVMDAWAKVNIKGYVSRQYSSTTIRLTKELHTKVHQAERAWMKAKFGKVRGNWKNMTAKDVQELSEVMFDAANVPMSTRAEFYRQFNKYIYSLTK